MTKTLDSFYKEKFLEFRALLINKWSVEEKRFKRVEDQVKPLHKRYLSLACSASVLGYRSKRNEYIESVVEVGLLSLILVLKGIENSSCVLLRQSIELVLKHIYFSTHPVEYEWAKSREGYREINFQMLMDYLSKTDECKNFNGSKQICEKIEERYGALSRHVHVHSSKFLSYQNYRFVSQPQERIIKGFDIHTKEIWPKLITLLIVYFPGRYLKASTKEKRIIRSSIPNHILVDIDNFISF